MFANLGDLDEVIGGWQNQGTGIREDGTVLETVATHHTSPPTNDVITVNYFAALSDAFQELTLHNHDMFTYTADYVDKLSASRERIAEDEHGAWQKFHRG